MRKMRAAFTYTPRDSRPQRYARTPSFYVIIKWKIKKNQRKKEKKTIAVVYFLMIIIIIKNNRRVPLITCIIPYRTVVFFIDFVSYWNNITHYTVLFLLFIDFLSFFLSFLIFVRIVFVVRPTRRLLVRAAGSGRTFRVVAVVRVVSLGVDNGRHIYGETKKKKKKLISNVKHRYE